MKVRLFDVNVLIALAWPNHLQHRMVHDWLARNPAIQFATCPMTQCGFVRISSNPKIIAEAVTPSEAISVLSQIAAHPNHIFWPDSIEISDLPVLLPNLLIAGHRQVTDAYLLALAVKNNGQVATMDKGLNVLAKGGNYVELISAAD